MYSPLSARLSRIFLPAPHRLIYGPFQPKDWKVRKYGSELVEQRRDRNSPSLPQRPEPIKISWDTL